MSSRLLNVFSRKSASRVSTRDMKKYVNALTMLSLIADQKQKQRKRMQMQDYLRAFHEFLNEDQQKEAMYLLRLVQKAQLRNPVTAQEAFKETFNEKTPQIDHVMYSMIPLVASVADVDQKLRRKGQTILQRPDELTRLLPVDDEDKLAIMNNYSKIQSQVEAGNFENLPLDVQEARRKLAEHQSWTPFAMFAAVWEFKNVYALVFLSTLYSALRDAYAKLRTLLRVNNMINKLKDVVIRRAKSIFTAPIDDSRALVRVGPKSLTLTNKVKK